MANTNSPDGPPAPSKMEDIHATADSAPAENDVAKHEPSPLVANGDDAANGDASPSLRPQQLPLPATLKKHKPSPHHVIVLAFGSFGIRYGFASDSAPKKLFPAVAFPRRSDATNSTPALRIPPLDNVPKDVVEAAREEFLEVCEQISNDLALNDRRRGGGKPIPWRVEVEPIQDGRWNDRAWLSDDDAWSFDNGNPIVGKDVLKLLRDPKRAAKYDIVLPFWDGELAFECGATVNFLRRAWDAILDHIVVQLDIHRMERKIKLKGGDAHSDDAERLAQHEAFVRENDGLATSFVSLVMPETSQRRDIAEIVAAVFRSRSLKCGAIFVHQNAVSCALGAGLATCAVVDIGHSATTVACVEDGIVCGESRIHLRYGSYHIQRAFELLLTLTKWSNFQNVVVEEFEHTNEETRPIVEDERSWLIAKVCEQAGGFNVDENDTLSVTQVKAPSGRSMRVKLGVGLRTVPAHGLIYPSLLKAAFECQSVKPRIPERGLFEKNSEDDNFVSDIFNDLRRSGIATAALPIGLFANDKGQPAEQKVDAKTASIVDAIIWSIAKAIEVKRPDQQTRTPDHYRRYLNAIVLAGGGASLDGIALALEGRIKKGFQDAGLMISDVTVIDGGKGKGDEELAAAAAVLKDVASEGGLLDDTDTASLPWNGTAVMVEADAVNDYWVYRDDWDARSVRALREEGSVLLVTSCY